MDRARRDAVRVFLTMFMVEILLNVFEFLCLGCGLLWRWASGLSNTVSTD
jgi:hypothetical protein